MLQLWRASWAHNANHVKHQQSKPEIEKYIDIIERLLNNKSSNVLITDDEIAKVEEP